MQLSPKTKSYISLLFVQLGFGAYGVITSKFAKGSMPPYIFALYRDLLTFPVLMLAAYFVEGLKLPTRRDVPLFLVVGLFLFGNQFLYLEGIYLTSAPIASAAQPLIPVVTSILAILTCTEAPPNMGAAQVTPPV